MKQFGKLAFFFIFILFLVDIDVLAEEDQKCTNVVYHVKRAASFDRGINDSNDCFYNVCLGSFSTVSNNDYIIMTYVNSEVDEAGCEYYHYGGRRQNEKMLTAACPGGLQTPDHYIQGASETDLGVAIVSKINFSTELPKYVYLFKGTKNDALNKDTYYMYGQNVSIDSDNFDDLDKNVYKYTEEISGSTLVYEFELDNNVITYTCLDEEEQQRAIEESGEEWSERSLYSTIYHAKDGGADLKLFYSNKNSNGSVQIGDSKKSITPLSLGGEPLVKAGTYNYLYTDGNNYYFASNCNMKIAINGKVVERLANYSQNGQFCEETDDSSIGEPVYGPYDDDFNHNCKDFAKGIRIIGLLLFLVKIVVPLIIIVLSAINIFNVVLKGDAGEMNNQIKKTAISILAAILIFFVPSVINVAFNMLNKTAKKEIRNSDSEICRVCIFEPFSKECKDSIDDDSTNSENGN